MSKYIVARALDWDAFASRHWDQRVVHFKATPANPFEEGAVFEAAAAAAGLLFSDREPEKEKEAGVVSFTIGRRQQARCARWVPRADDGSFEGYGQRLGHALGSERYALIINTFHSFSFALWSRQRAFFGELWRRVGLPLTGAITTLFHGNYEHTPVGVHKDRFSTFLFAVAGKKRMRFWPERPWTDPATSRVTAMLDYQAHLESSFTVDVEPGDILYWPSTYYHVGESRGGGVATSVNVGIPRTEHRAIYELQELLVDIDDAPTFVDPGARMRRTLLSRGGGDASMKSTFAGDGTLSPALPRPLERALEAFRARTRPGAVERRLRETSLRRSSAVGFAPVPPAAPRRRLRDGDRVSGDPRYPILWTPDGPRSCLYGANGHSHRVVAPAAEVARIVKQLNSGRPVRVGSLGQRSMLERLESFRAIERLERIV